MACVQKRKLAGRIVVHIVCILTAAICVFPFLYMFFISLQPNNEAIFKIPPSIVPETWEWSNYVYAFRQMHFLRAFGNTMLILVTVMGLNMIGSTLVAYGFSRFSARGKGLTWAVLMGTMMLPWAVTMVPAFVIFKAIGWIGTRLPLIIPAFGGSAYNIFMLRQFMMGMPKELDEAAKLDGCSDLGILFRILLPNMLPVYATLFIFLFTAMWSDYLSPRIYLIKETQHTISLALYKLRTAYSIDWKSTMAGSVLFTIPMVVVLFSMQRYFVEGVVVTGLK